MSESLGKNQQEAWGALLLAHAVLTRKIDRLLTLEGMPTLQVYDVLLALEDAPQGRLRMGDLAAIVVFDPSSVTRIIDRLEKQGLVRREVDCEDRRRIFACITQKGRQLREDSWPVYRRLVAEHFGAQLSAVDAQHITSGLLAMFPGHPRLKSIRVNCGADSGHPA